METLTPIQQRIYEGLKNIGEALANFYLDGVRMAAPEFTLLSKANMLAHAAREIDGGLRETFAPKALAAEKSSQISKKGKQGSGHLASILIAVGKDDPQNELANRWFAIASHFHSLAHRKQIHEGSADSGEITRLWAEYESVLDIVIGSFLGITNRLDVLLNFDLPDPLALPALKNVLNNPRHAHYFFTKLDKPGWLIPLKKMGFFEGAAASANSDEATSVERWWPVRYLLSISTKVTSDEEATLSQIVAGLMKTYTTGEIKLHAFVVSDLLDILINVEHYSFGKAERDFIEKYGSSGETWSLVHTRLTEGFADKLVAKKDVEGLKNLLDYFLGFTVEEHPAISFFGEEAKPYFQNKPNVQKHYITQLLERHGDDIMELLGVEAIKITISKLEEIVRSGSYILSYDNPKSIEETSQTIYSHDWEDEIVYFIRDYAVKLPTQQLDALVDEMLDSKIQILQRLAIHFIRINYAIFNSKWWRFVDSTGADDSIYIHEPYVLLQEHSKDFTDEQFEKILAWIERLNPARINEDGTEERRHAGSYKRRWLTALQPSTPQRKRLLTDKEAFYQTWYDGKLIDHPEFDSFGTTHYGADYPIEPEEFLKLPVQEQIQFIQTYVPEHPHDTSEEGLADLVAYAAKTSPDKYLYSLTDFLPLHSLYLSHLVDGLTEALQKEKVDDFSLVLVFVEAKLSDPEFGNEPEKKFLFKRWLARSIAEFVKTVSFHHQRLSVQQGDVARMVTLVLGMINNPMFQDEDESHWTDYVNHVLNSTSGRFYLTLIELTKLWVDKFSTEHAKGKWPDVVKEHFTERVKSHAVKDKDFSIVLGMEMQLLLYLDPEWVEEHVKDIFDEQNADHFDFRLHATLYRASQPSKTFYNFFEKHSLFRKALKYLRHESAALSSVLTYALVEWKFWNGKPESDGILAQVLAQKDPEQIKQLVRVVFERRLLSSEELIYLWERLMPVFDTTPSLADYYPILLWLFERLPNLDEKSFDLATATIAKAKGGREIYSYLRHLYQIFGSEIERAGKLVLQVYEAKLVSPFYEQELKKLVKELYEKGFKKLADAICIQLAEQHSLELKDLYNEYN